MSWSSDVVVMGIIMSGTTGKVYTNKCLVAKLPNKVKNDIEQLKLFDLSLI
jgi:hypothetical protein